MKIRSLRTGVLLLVAAASLLSAQTPPGTASSSLETSIRNQIDQLRLAGQPSPPQKVVLKSGTLNVTIPPQGLGVLKIESDRAPH